MILAIYPEFIAELSPVYCCLVWKHFTISFAGVSNTASKLWGECRPVPWFVALLSLLVSSLLLAHIFFIFISLMQKLFLLLLFIYFTAPALLSKENHQR